MCGIIAVIHPNNISQATKTALNKFIADGVVVGQVRGDDSTGMFQVRDGVEDVRAYKAAWCGAQFAEDNRAKALINNVDISKITVVHHRAATFGSVCPENAHPFMHKNKQRKIIGVHNGHISNYKVNDGGEQFFVDSDWAFWKIFNEGGKAAIEQFEGAMSLVWYENDGKIRMYSNGKRPLFWNYVRDENVMLVCSEHEMMYMLAYRNGLKLDKAMCEPFDDRIYTVDPENVRKYTTEKITKKSLAPVQHTTDTERKGWHGQSIGMRGSNSWEAKQQAYVPPAISGGIFRTIQGQEIVYSREKVSALGFEMNEEVEFVYNKHFGQNVGSPINIFGEVLLDLDEDKGGVKIIPSVIIDANYQLRQNIAEVSDQGGYAYCRVMAATEIIASGKKVPGLVLSRPNYLKIGDKRLSPPTMELMSIRRVPVAGGILVSLPKFGELVKDGCDGCAGRITVVDAQAGKVGWTKDQKPICPDCRSKYIKDDMTVTQDDLQKRQDDAITQALIAEQAASDNEIKQSKAHEE